MLFVDDGATLEQVEAIATILSGQAGGMPWEAPAGTVEELEGPIVRPIDLAVKGQQARVRIAGAVELETTLRVVATLPPFQKNPPRGRRCALPSPPR